MEHLLTFSAFIIGVIVGVAATAVAAGRSYDRGREDERNSLENDTTLFLEDTEFEDQL